MTDNFDIVFPPTAQRAQAERGSAAAYAGRRRKAFRTG